MRAKFLGGARPLFVASVMLNVALGVTFYEQRHAKERSAERADARLDELRDCEDRSAGMQQAFSRLTEPKLIDRLYDAPDPLILPARDDAYGHYLREHQHNVPAER